MVALISLVVILVTGYLIVKKYNPQMVLFIAGIVLLASAILLGVGTPLPEAKSSGSVWLDIFTYIKGMMGSTVADLGLIIMAVSLSIWITSVHLAPWWPFQLAHCL